MTTTAPAARPSALRRLGRFCYRRHWLVIIVWLAVILVTGAASAAGDGYTNSFGDFRSEATRGFDLVAEGFPGENTGEASANIVIEVSPTVEGGVENPEIKAALTEFFAEIPGHAPKGVLTVTTPYDNPRQVAAKGDLAGRVAYATVNMPGDTSRTSARAGPRPSGPTSPRWPASSTCTSAASSSPSSSRPSRRSSASGSPSSS